MADKSKLLVYSRKYRELPDNEEEAFTEIDKNNSKNLVEIEKNIHTKIAQKNREALIYIQKITKNIVSEIFEIFPMKKLNVCAKLLNFPEKIYIDEIDKNEPKIYFEKYNYISMNYSGTIQYFDSIKGMGSEINKSNSLRNAFLGQEIAFNLGKLVYFLLNGVDYSTKSQMYKKNDSKLVQNFFDLTLRNFTTIKSPNDIKLIDFISLDDKQIKKYLTFNSNNELSEMTSYISNEVLGDLDNEEKGKFIGNDITYLYYYGIGIIQTCFSIIPKKRKRNEFEKKINDKIINAKIEELNKKVDKISEEYLGV